MGGANLILLIFVSGRSRGSVGPVTEALGTAAVGCPGMSLVFFDPRGPPKRRRQMGKGPARPRKRPPQPPAPPRTRMRGRAHGADICTGTRLNERGRKLACG